MKPAAARHPERIAASSPSSDATRNRDPLVRSRSRDATEITIGKRQGMISLEDSLARLVRQGHITIDDARIRAPRPEELDSLLR